ncbi:MAG: hypothetical protein WC788_08125 [Candidatus Paceibacterota bacterium]
MEFKKYAKRVVGIEKNEERFRKAKKKGIEVYLGIGQDVSIPEADVYYLWLTGREPYYILKNIKKGVIVAGMNGYSKEDLAMFIPPNAEITGVRHDEWDSEGFTRGWDTNNHIFKLAIWTKELK